MMALVADTGPLNYLIQIEGVVFLPDLFYHVSIPDGVFRELTALAAPASVRNWARQLPAWCSVHIPQRSRLTACRGLSPVDVEVLALATNGNAAVLLDDLAARNAARRLGLTLIGTLGVLELAAAKQLLSFPEFIKRLRRTNIHISETLYAEALRRSASR